MGLIAFAFGYLLGSIPFALLLTQPRGIDLRTVGSRNVGAANVLRTAGVVPAVAVMLLDSAKGAIAVIVARLVTDDLLVVTIAGLAPLATAVAALVFVATVLVTRFISAGSIAGALTLAVAAAASNVPAPVAAGATLAAILVVHRHRDNLSRLIAGTERRIGLR